MVARYGGRLMITDGKANHGRPDGAPWLGRLFMLVLLGGLWFLELLDQLSGNQLDQYGIHAREVDGMPEILTAPFLHAGWDHLISNSLPFLVLGFLVLLSGLARWLVSSLIIIIISGMTAWFLTPVHTIILGASGLIFGWLTYLLARGIWSRRPAQVAWRCSCCLCTAG